MVVLLKVLSVVVDCSLYTYTCTVDPDLGHTWILCKGVSGRRDPSGNVPGVDSHVYMLDAAMSLTSVLCQWHVFLLSVLRLAFLASCTSALSTETPRGYFAWTSTMEVVSPYSTRLAWRLRMTLILTMRLTLWCGRMPAPTKWRQRSSPVELVEWLEEVSITISDLYCHANCGANCCRCCVCC